MQKEDVKYDCSHFEGHIPCKANKEFDVQCDNCSHYTQDISSIIHLDTKKLLLQEIFKICNFSNQNLEEETPKIQTQSTKI